MPAWTDIALVVITAVSTAAAWFGFRDSRSDRGEKKVQDQIDHSIQPVDSRITVLEQKFAGSIDLNQQALEAAIMTSLQPVLGDIQVLQTQMSVFWKDVVHNQAQVLHQPDPRRHHIDVLLEALMEDRITEEESDELRGYLLKIRNWEPGMDVGFPVHPGEPTSAGILLATLDHILPSRRKSGDSQ